MFVNGRTTFDDDVPEDAAEVPVLKKTDGSRPLTQRHAKTCIVCWEAPISAVAVPCGHAVACWECLMKVRDMRLSGCPLCRGQIREVSKLLQQSSASTVPESSMASQVNNTVDSSTHSRQRKPQAYVEG